MSEVRSVADIVLGLQVRTNFIGYGDYAGGIVNAEVTDEGLFLTILWEASDEELAHQESYPAARSSALLRDIVDWNTCSVAERASVDEFLLMTGAPPPKKRKPNVDDDAPPPPKAAAAPSAAAPSAAARPRKPPPARKPPSP